MTKAVKRTSPIAEATIKIACRSKKQMQAVAEALSPELAHPAGEKAEASLFMLSKGLKFRFVARDASSLRAIMTSYLRLLAATLNVSASLTELERKRARKTDH